MSTAVPWFRFGVRDIRRRLRHAKQIRDTLGAMYWTDALHRARRIRKRA